MCSTAELRPWSTNCAIAKLSPWPRRPEKRDWRCRRFAPDDPQWTQAWAVTDRLLIAMADEAQSHGATLAVLMANCGVEVDPQDAAREPLLAQLGVADLRYPERRVAALGATHGFRVIRLAEAMHQYCRDYRVYAHGFANTRPGTGHWNETGHRVAGELAARQLMSDDGGTAARHASGPLPR